MTRDDIIRLAREAGAFFDGDCSVYDMPEHCFEKFAALVAAAEREKVARWIIHKGYATGHGDTIEDLLTELEWQVAEREREACCKIVHGQCESDNVAQRTVDAIRARGEE